jgi:ElaB/YqjD/DUF883 family membrane-anchored ribosome-binding protein
MADKSSDATEMHAQIEALRKEIVAIAGIVGEIAGPAARKRALRTAKQLRKQAEGAISDAEDYVDDSTEAIEDAIREHPMQSALLAFGAGILVGKLFLGKGR